MDSFINKLKKFLGPSTTKILAVTGILAILYLVYLWFEKENRVRKG